MKDTSLTFAARGSAALPMLFTTLGVVSFVLLFSNVSRYVAARGATQHAAERAARCLAATDAGCLHSEVSTSVEPPAWWGRAAREEVTVFARHGSYSAELPQTEWSAGLKRYRLRSERRHVSWPEQQLKVTRVIALLNSWASLEARVEVRLQDTATSEVFVCRLDEKRTVPWGLDFKDPSSYFDSRWCGASVVAEAIAASSCSAQFASIAPDRLRPLGRAEWGGSSCALVLPGVAVRNGEVQSSNDQPWLLLGGKPVCDEEVTYAGGQLSVPLPDSAPWTAEPAASGHEDRPFVMTVDRQYIVLDVVSCQSPEQVRAQIAAALPSDSTPEQIAAFLGARRSLDGAQFDPYEFSEFEASRSPSLFLDASSAETSLVAVPSVYSWTFLRWERQVEKRDSVTGAALAVGDPKAERTVLSRKICSWHTWEEAQSQRFSGIDSARPLPAAIRVAVADTSCVGLTPLTPAPTFRCENAFSYDPSGAPLSDCQGWEAREAALQTEFRDEIERAEGLLDAVPGLRSAIPALPSFAEQTMGEWTAATEAQWFTVTAPGGQRVDADYLRELEPLELRLVTTDTAQGAAREPVMSDWIALFESAGASEYADWSVFRQAPDVEVAQKGARIARFDGLVAHPYLLDGQTISLLPDTLNTSRGFDYDLDCRADTTCAQENAAPAALLWQQVQAQYAGSLPPRADTRVVFSAPADEQYVRLGSFALEELDALRGALPRCTATVTSCGFAAAADAPLQFVARGYELPELCRSGSFIDCEVRSELHSIVEPAIEIEELRERAQVRALAELTRLFPATIEAERCAEASCLETEIHTSADIVEVRTRFLMPIGFPLSGMLKQPFVEIDGYARELQERRFARE